MRYQKQSMRAGITRHMQRAILVAIARQGRQAMEASSSNRKRPSVLGQVSG